jgi:hypothetical protein
VYAGCATLARPALVGGTPSGSAPGIQVPLKSGLPLQPGAFCQPPGPETSTRSDLERPKVVLPHVRTSSFVCSGPLISSSAENWIGTQPAGRAARGCMQF